MKANMTMRMLLAAGVTALLLAASLVGLSLGQPIADTSADPSAQLSTGFGLRNSRQPTRGRTQSDACDTVCVDESCRTIPVDWLGTITITDTFMIYPTSACLCENEDGTKRVEGEGEFFLPNMQTDETDAIYVTFILSWPDLEPQCVHFTGTWEEGVPIGETSFLLTGLEGNVTFDPEPAIQVSGTIESGLQAPDGSGPAVTGEGTLEVSLEEPYDMAFEGTLTVLTLRAVQAAVTLDQSWGFAGSVTLTGTACGGGAYLHVWEESEGTYGFSGGGDLTCTITADSLTPEGWPRSLPGIPPEDLTVSTEGEVGEFCLACDGSQCADRTYGVWAGTVLDLDLPEAVVEPGVITARFFVSSTGILSVTTNLQRCQEREADFGFRDSDFGTHIPQSAIRNPQSGGALFCLNQAPAITITSPSAVEEQPGEDGFYTIRWTADDPDDEAIVSLYYDRDGTGRDGRLIACCLSEGDGTYSWDTSEVGSGTYYVYGRIDDGKNLAAVDYGDGTVTVVDTTPPASPSAPSVSLEGSGIVLRWQANAEQDVVGYRVHYGPEPGVYVGSVSVQNLAVDGATSAVSYAGSYNATNVTWFRPPWEPSPQTAYMAVSAYDSSGNVSPPSPPARLWFVYLPAVLKNPR